MRKTTPIANALIVLVILTSISFLSYRVFFRADLTENKEYTLSQATKNILAQLDDVVNVHVYFSKELPSYFASLDRQVKDLMDEYSAHGRGNVAVDFIDPADDPALEQSMQRMGIPKLQLTRYEKERAEAMSAYLGIAVEFEGKTEVIPVVQGVERLEYDLTAALVKVSTQKQTVGIATSGSLTVPEGYQQLQEILRQQYTPRVVNINEDPVPVEVTTLVVIDDDGFTDEALYRIDQFLMTGGKILFLAGGVNVDLGTLMARNREVKVGPLLQTYGVKVDNALVVDGQAPLVGFDVGTFFPLSIRYPWFPQIVEDGLSRDNPITSEMQSLVLPWTSPLQIVGSDTSGIVIETLARSSKERSFASTTPYDMNPQRRIQLPQTGPAPQILAVAMAGRFHSHYAGGQPVPGDSLGTAPPTVEESPETQVVVVGSSYFLENRFLQQFATNSVFLANTVDWMTLGNDLIAIRSRSAVSRPLKEIDDGQKPVLKALAIFPVPILVILFGLIRAQIGRNRRNRFAIEFGRRTG